MTYTFNLDRFCKNSKRFFFCEITALALNNYIMGQKTTSKKFVYKNRHKIKLLATKLLIGTPTSPGLKLQYTLCILL